MRLQGTISELCLLSPEKITLNFLNEKQGPHCCERCGEVARWGKRQGREEGDPSFVLRRKKGCFTTKDGLGAILLPCLPSSLTRIWSCIFPPSCLAFLLRGPFSCQAPVPCLPPLPLPHRCPPCPCPCWGTLRGPPSTPSPPVLMETRSTPANPGHQVIRCQRHPSPLLLRGLQQDAATGPGTERCNSSLSSPHHRPKSSFPPQGHGQPTLKPRCPWVRRQSTSNYLHCTRGATTRTRLSSPPPRRPAGRTPRVSCSPGLQTLGFRTPKVGVHPRASCPSASSRRWGSKQLRPGSLESSSLVSKADISRLGRRITICSPAFSLLNTEVGGDGRDPPAEQILGTKTHHYSPQK